MHLFLFCFFKFLCETQVTFFFLLNILASDAKRVQFRRWNSFGSHPPLPPDVMFLWSELRRFWLLSLDFNLNLANAPC